MGVPVNTVLMVCWWRLVCCFDEVVATMVFLGLCGYTWVVCFRDYYVSGL